MIDTLIHCINIYVSNYYKPLLDIVYSKLLFRINISYTQILDHFQKKIVDSISGFSIIYILNGSLDIITV